MISANNSGSGNRFACWISELVGSSVPHLRDGASAIFAGDPTRSAHTRMLFPAAICQEVATIWFNTGMFEAPSIKAFRAPVLSTRSMIVAFADN